jgi:hypothetical protein
MNEGHYENRKRGKYYCTLKNGHWTKSEHFPTKEPKHILRALAQGKRPQLGFCLGYYYEEYIPGEDRHIPGLSKWKRYFGGESLRGTVRNHNFYSQ